MWLAKLCSAQASRSSRRPVNKVMDNGSSKEREVSSIWNIRKDFLEEVIFKPCIDGKVNPFHKCWNDGERDLARGNRLLLTPVAQNPLTH